MGSNSKQVLLVGDVQLDYFLGYKAVTQPIQRRVEFTRVSSYQTAIQFVKYGHWDAVLVSQEFDSHLGLEFVNHARLLDSQTPIVLVVDAEDDDLDYKARKIGATDSIDSGQLNRTYLNALFDQREKPARRNKNKTSNPLFSIFIQFL